MPHAVADGIGTSYEVAGSGPPILMFSPGGFNAVAGNWATLGVYRRLRLLDHLSPGHTCVTFDRRESGGSGGRVERLSWARYAAQAAGLLDHLGIGRAFLMGGCAGCSVALAFAVAHPDRVAGMVLFWPAGGVRYRMRQHARINAHLAYAGEHGLGGLDGLDGVVALARESAASFTEDPRVGPWASVVRGDAAFAAEYAALDPGGYEVLVSGGARLLFDRDTVPGAEPEDLLGLEVPALVVPGQDESHATSGARYLQECLPRAEYWDVPAAEQTEERVAARIVEFLRTQGSGSPRSSAVI